MRLIGMMPARNEAWCLRLTLNAALTWLDHLIVLDHGSTDETPDILASFHAANSDRVTVMEDTSESWSQSAQRQAMLDVGRDLGGTHFALVDADELLTANCVNFAKEMMCHAQFGWGWTMPWLCLWRSPTQIRIDNSPFGANRCQCKAWFGDYPSLTYVNQSKDGTTGYDFHDRFPQNLVRTDKLNCHDPEGGLPVFGMLHLQHVVWERLLWKHVWYQLEEVVRWGKVRANYAGTVDETGIQLADAPAKWFRGLPGTGMGLLDLKAEPWQKKACMKMVQQHGFDFFNKSGVDWFGLDNKTHVFSK